LPCITLTGKSQPKPPGHRVRTPLILDYDVLWRNSVFSGIIGKYIGISHMADLLRTIAERLSRGVVFQRRMPRDFGGGKIFVSPDAGLRFYRQDLAAGDAILFKMADELVKTGDVVWDVGANVGLFTFGAANRAGETGEVVAIEADLWLVSLLRRSCTLLDRSRNAAVTVLPAAASDSLGLAKFHIASRARSSNHLEGVGSTQAGGTRGTESVMTITLDWLLRQVPAPQVLKIDVEGMEHRVLAGATALLSKERPVIWCEVDPMNKDEVTRILHAHDYEIFYGNLDPSQRQPLQRAPWETLACPRPPSAPGHAIAGQKLQAI
jgi:FkbM family methyltransferase